MSMVVLQYYTMRTVTKLSEFRPRTELPLLARGPLLEYRDRIVSVFSFLAQTIHSHLHTVSERVGRYGTEVRADLKR